MLAACCEVWIYNLGSVQEQHGTFMVVGLFCFHHIKIKGRWQRSLLV